MLVLNSSKETSSIILHILVLTYYIFPLRGNRALTPRGVNKKMYLLICTKLICGVQLKNIF